MSETTQRVQAGPRNIKLTVEYEGTRYLGWQKQRSGPSIQQSMEEGLEAMLQHPVRLTVAGRTDAGVHALGQVCNFQTETTIETRRFIIGLNHFLPDDIRVHRAEEMPASFHARTDSIYKRYRYRIHNAAQPRSLGREQAYWVRKDIDAASMHTASRVLLGEHDFESFRSVHCDAAHAIRRIDAIDITQTPFEAPLSGTRIDITVQGNAFCRHMVRILAGSLLEVGLARWTEADLDAALKAKKRSAAGPTAPAKGLTLLEVVYP